nr:FtsQ-type POTRA domain-containing protein [Lysinibacter cavernae]
MRTVEVVGATRLDTAAVTEALSSQKNVPLTLIDRSAVEEALGQFSIIQSYSLEMVPPHTMVVRVIERQPIAAVATTNGFELVDPAGVVIETTPERPAGFPLVLAVAPDPESAPFQAIANALLSVSPELVARLDTVTATTGEDVVFKFADNGLNVIWGSSEDSAVKSVILEKMVAALAGQPVTNIDVSSIDAPVYS